MTVVIPVYNRARLVRRAVESVCDQTFNSLEVIVVDDGSTDDLTGSLGDIEDPRLRLIRLEQNAGVSVARNHGIAAARGEYIAFLDSDDYWLPTKLERQVAFMRENGAGARLSCTAYKILSPYYPNGESRYANEIITDNDMRAGCRLSPGTTLLAEASLFRDVGPLNPELSRLEDWDWLLRAGRLSQIRVLNEVLCVVDYSKSQAIDYDALRASVEVMKTSHFVTRGPIPSIARLRFRSTLENELAAAAYRNRQYGLAFRHLAKSLLWFPYRNWDFFKRVTNATFRDIFRRGRPRQRDASI